MLMLDMGCVREEWDDTWRWYYEHAGRLPPTDYRQTTWRQFVCLARAEQEYGISILWPVCSPPPTIRNDELTFWYRGSLQCLPDPSCMPISPPSLCFVQCLLQENVLDYKQEKLTSFLSVQINLDTTWSSVISFWLPEYNYCLFWVELTSFIRNSRVNKQTLVEIDPPGAKEQNFYPQTERQIDLNWAQRQAHLQLDSNFQILHHAGPEQTQKKKNVGTGLIKFVSLGMFCWFLWQLNDKVNKTAAKFTL